MHAIVSKYLLYYLSDIHIKLYNVLSELKVFYCSLIYSQLLHYHFVFV